MSLMVVGVLCVEAPLRSSRHNFQVGVLGNGGYMRWFSNVDGDLRHAARFT